MFSAGDGEVKAWLWAEILKKVRSVELEEGYWGIQLLREPLRSLIVFLHEGLQGAVASSAPIQVSEGHVDRGHVGVDLLPHQS